MSGQDSHRYPCATQQTNDFIVGATPHVADPAFTDDEAGGAGIVVGVGRIIPRWVPSSTNPTPLIYFVVREGFSNDEDYRYTAQCFKDAADEWNAIGLGIKFSETSDRAAATFVVQFYRPPVDKGTIASAFFPNQVTPVLVYEKTLVEDYWRKILKNSFLHEIGHILGLRHEFAIEKEGDGALRYLSTNANSVMSYDDVNIIRDSDKSDTLKFYQLPRYSEISGVKIYDYTPKPYPQ